jgi:sugar (pentulose or hexulose) kinase
MSFISVDLGTTNIKVTAYDKKLNVLSEKAEKVQYISEGSIVEFDADVYYLIVQDLITECCITGFKNPDEVIQIILTGQAESLISLDKKGNPIRNGISWLDMRSEKECAELKSVFDEALCYKITGQPSIIPTWPITKMLWLNRNEPEVFAEVAKYLMLKDYIQYRLTDIMVGEYSIYSFTHYFDITKKEYWTDILDYCKVRESQLPALVEPCTNIGAIKKDVAQHLNVSQSSTVNVGTLDHFAGMIGTGNTKPGLISETTGTVLSIATLVNSPLLGDIHIPCHYGPFKDTYALLPVCESGGVSLEWYKNGMMHDVSYDEINVELSKRDLPNELIFLPYITGVNAPDFNEKANGVFYGIKLKHDQIDFAYAIMEGIAHLFAVNVNYMKKIGVNPNMIISTGGGAKSDIWSQIKADISGNIVAIPENEETACLGAAIIGAVHSEVFDCYETAAKSCVSIKKQFTPNKNKKLVKKHSLFEQVYNNLLPVFDFDWES